MLAIIGGSGLTQLANLEITSRQIVRTPYGEPSGPLAYGRLAGSDVAFLPRHGYGHTLAPHEINYRANIWALHSRGVKCIAAVCTVGGITPEHPAGSLAVPDQLIDYTWGRRSTFFEGSEQPVTHIDFTNPYDESARQMCIVAAREAGIAIVPSGTYAATQGPRLETRAEIDRLERDGATLVGMTGMPEAALARELGLKYAMIAVVVNSAAGRRESESGIVVGDIGKSMEAAMAQVRVVVERIVESYGQA